MNKKSIRKIIIGLLLCLGISMVYEINNTIPVLAADTVTVMANNVNVRSQPSTNSKSYGKVAKGTVLQRYEERADGWSCVDYSGKQAYIKTDFLVIYTGAAAATPAVVAAPAAASGKAAANTSASGTNYIANKNTHKFHYPSCSSVSDMSEKNKWYFNGTRDELINKGYVPCKRCKP